MLNRVNFEAFRACEPLRLWSYPPCPDHIDWHDRYWYQRLTARLNNRVFNLVLKAQRLETLLSIVEGCGGRGWLIV
jgi:hypothetical protein